jgi:putative ABC transport system ATP-binding protein
VLRLERLSKVYRDPGGDVVALRDVTHTFAVGKLTAIMGPSGSGKSTLLNVAALLDTPSAGKVYLDEQEITQLSEDARAELRLKRFGFVFQSYNLISVLSAQQNVAFPMGLAGVPREEQRRRSEALLARFGLLPRANHLPHKLSGGEKQRVALARALANDPAIVFADEPTGNLDSKSGAQVAAALKAVAREGRSVVVVTHDLRLATQADEVLELEDGVLREGRQPSRTLLSAKEAR